MTYQIISTDEALRQLIDQHRDCDTVAVDTEFMRRNTFYPQLALVQLCFDGAAWLLDPLQINDFSPLGELFRNPQIVKVLHSGSEDIEVFEHFLGVQPTPLFDSQKAAAYLGMGHGLGYRALIEELLGESVPKGETRSNWLARPLSESQLQYAALDVIHLLPAYRKLQSALGDTEKWHCVLEDGAWATAQAGQHNAYYPRIKSAWKLPPNQLCVLAALCDWREKTARSSDKPRSWIVEDKHCLLLAERLPVTPAALAALDDIPQAARRKHGQQWLDLIAANADGHIDTLPPPLNASQREILKKLKSRARQIAADWGASPEIMLPAKDYELLVRIASGDPREQPRQWQGWRQQRLIVPLLALAKGQQP